MENTLDHTSFEFVLEHEEQEHIGSKTFEVQWSTYERRLSAWHSKYVIESNIAYCLLIELEKVQIYSCGWQQCKKRLKFHKRIKLEILFLYHKKGRPLTTNGFTKRDWNDQMKSYSTRLVVKRYAKNKIKINFN